MYEQLQSFVLRVFELTFLELLYIGFPVSIYTIIGTLAGIDIFVFPIILTLIIGAIWFGCVVMMWTLAPVWSIPVGKETPVIETKKRIFRG